MSGPLPGQVRIEGLFEGPASAWTPEEDRLRDALRSAGAPDNALEALIEGGQASLAPCPMALPRGQFASDPAEAVALALEMLLEQTADGRPREWYSTLRVYEYGEDKVRETLIRVEDEGVHTATRERDWEPVAAPSLLQRARRNLGLILLVTAGAGIGAWLQREELRGWADGVLSLFAGGMAVAGEATLDPGPFAPWIAMSGAQAHERGEDFHVSLRALDGYPRTGAEVDALRRDAGPERLAALRAMEAGEARLALHFENGDPEEIAVDLLKLSEQGELTVVVEAAPRRGRVLEGMRLEP